jgi:hypothetical protein
MKHDTPQNKAKLLKALVESHGIITTACKKVGLSRECFYFYIKNDPQFKEDYEKLNDSQLDFVETKLFEKIDEGSEKSIHFYLRYKGKPRGYSDSISLEANINVEQPLLSPLKPKKDE